MAARLTKPATLHDREHEWRTLGEFARHTAMGATLGLVYGRRRQGKTYLLAQLTRATGGFMFSGSQQSDIQNLREISAAYHRHLDRPAAAFGSWTEAVDALFRLGERARPVTVVLDEFPYLLAGASGLASIIQIALDPLSRARERSRTRLILCGSEMTTMAGLLGGTAPLRGRALVEMVVHPFDFRDSADFWGLRDEPEIAFRVNALVGGTPAYRDMAGGPPTGRRDFDAWVAGRLFDPARVMFHEGNVLLQEQPEISDPAVYFAVLAAISRGAHRRSEIAAAIDRANTALAHPLGVLESVRLIERLADAFRQQRATYQITEPVIRLHQLLIRPNESRLALREGATVWADEADTIASKIYGPHFESLARQWCLAYAGAQTLGGRANWVRPATLPCREHREGHQLDVVAVRSMPFESDQVLAIGEAKGRTKPTDAGELARLEHLRELIPADRLAGQPKLLLFARAGFTRALQTAATGRSDVELIDLDRLYNGF